MKNLLLLCLLLITFKGQAQSGDTFIKEDGSTCASAKTFLPDTLLPQIEKHILTHAWYKFKAKNISLDLTFLEYNANSANKMLTVKLWSGGCGSLTNLGTDTITNPTDSSLFLTSNSLVIGDTYYVEIIKTAASSPALKFLALFDFKLSPAATCSSECSSPPSCDLVCNGSFETLTSLPISGVWSPGQVTLACPWENGNTVGSADVFNAACNGGTFDVPANVVGSQMPLSGDGYAGLATIYFPPGLLREYMKAPLRCNLIAGVTYSFTYNVCLSKRSYYAGRLTGFVCAGSSIPTSSASPLPPPTAGPGTHALASGFITNNLTWTTFTTTFVANGTEDYIIFGNFEPTNVIGIADVTANYDGAYVYIDDVSLTPVNTLTISATPATICPGNIALLTSNISPSPELEWSPSGSVVSNPSTSTYTIPLYSTTTFEGTITYCKGCQYTALTTVNVYPDPVITVNSPITCEGVATTLTASGASSYTWSSGATATAINTASVAPLVTTTYTVTGVDATGCIGTAVATVTVKPKPPLPVVVGPAAACNLAGNTYTITNFNNAALYSLTLSPVGAGTITALNALGQFNITWNSNVGGSISITVTESNECSNITTINVSSCCSWNNPTKPAFIDGNNVTTMQSVPGGFASLGSSSTISNRDFSINGTFTVDKNLTINGCNVILGNNAKIVINPGKVLSIQSIGSDASHLFACDQMWDGIYIDGTNPSTALIVTSSSIEDALNAVVSINGGKYTITNSKFNKNFANIVIQTYSGPSHPGTIAQTSITCATGASPYATPFTYPGTYLRPPFGAFQYSFSGVGVTGVNSVQIGDPLNVSLRNTFDNLFVGIASSNSNVTVYNNSFNNINYAINAIANNITPKTLTVGGSIITPTQANSFSNPTALNQIGLLVTDNMNLVAKNNTFTNMLEGIQVLNCKFRLITIESNSLVNCKRAAIKCLEVGNSRVLIGGNQINQSGNPSVFNDIGIQLQNVNKVPTNFLITGNTINRMRLGIWVTNVTKLSTYWSYGISGPVITFSQTDAQLMTGFFSCGIRLESSDQVGINGATVQRSVMTTPGPALANRLQGIHLQDCKLSMLVNNILHHMGNGIDWALNNNTSIMWCNNIKWCYNGVMLEPGVIIGDQDFDGSQGYNNNPPVHSADNKWQFDVNKDINGTTMGAPTKWYYRNLGAPWHIPTRPTNPPINFLTFLTQNPTNGTTCANTVVRAPIDFRNDVLGPIVKNQLTYNFLPQESRHADKEFAYQTLLQDSLISLGAPDDSVYQNFYLAMDNSNSGRFHKVQELSEHYNIALAHSQNAAIAPNSLIENNRKEVNEIYLNTWLSGIDTFTVSQRADLENIAYQNPVEGGVAVYSARVLLQIEVNDEITDPSRMMQEIVPTATSLFSKFNPNPTNSTTTLNYQLQKGQSAHLELFDIRGIKVAKYIMNEEGNQLVISSDNLQNGIYIYRIIMDDAIIDSGKLVIIK